MYMEESEIIDKFKRADNKKETLQILADLNDCSKDEMKSFLLEHGVSEDDFPRRGRKSKAAKKEAKEEDPHLEPVKTVAQMMEMSDLTPEEQKRKDRATSIPEPVRRVVTDRVESLTKEIMEMEKERDCLCDYLEGVVHSEAS